MVRSRLGWCLGAIAMAAACGGATSSSSGVDGGATTDGGGSSSSSGGSSGSASSTSSSGGPIGDGTPVAPMDFIVRTIHLGEADRGGLKDKNAWTLYGRNMDGLSTVVAGPSAADLATVCQRRSGAPASIHNDGPNGLDNSWGKELLKLLDPLSPSPTQASNDAIEAGARTLVMSLSGNGGAVLVAEKHATPTWAATEKRDVTAASMSSGAPVTTIKGGIAPDGSYEALVTGATTLTIPMQGQAFVIPIRAMVIRMKIAADNLTVTDGTISGVVPTEEMVTSFRKLAGAFSPELCSGTTVEGIAESFRQASDIMIDGTQDPTKQCDAISIGIGFEATRVVVGDPAAPVAPPADPCQ